MPVDLKNRPEEDTGDSGIHPDWYNPSADSLEDSYNSPSATDDNLPEGHPSRSDSKDVSADELRSEEASANNPTSTNADKEEQENTNTEDAAGWKTNVKNIRSNSNTLKKLGIGSGIAGILVIALVALISFLMPFKLTGIIENIEQRVGQVPDYAVERRLEFYMSRYLMIRALEETGEFDFSPNGADRNRFTYLGNGFWDTMYTNWKGAKLENKLVRDYGVKLRADVKPEMFNANYKARASDFRIEHLGTGTGSDLHNQTLNRPEARQFIREFAKTETKSRQVFKRYNTRRVLKKYYGVGNWRPFEKSTDKVKNKYYEKKRAFRGRLINETMGRLSERYPLYLECMLDGANHKSCRDKLKRADPDSGLPRGNPDEDGTNDAVEEFEADQNGERDDSNSKLSRRIMDKVQEFGLKKILTSLAAGIGIIDTLNQMYNTVDSGVLNQVIYDKNAQQYLAYSAPILSAADQIRAGDDNFDAEDAQVANEIFSGFEQSLVYQAGSPKSDSIVSAAGSYYADCNDSSTDGRETLLEPGETVCPDKRLIQDKTKFTESEGWQALGTILKPYRNSLGKIVSGITNAIGIVLNATGITNVISSISSFFGIDNALAKSFAFLLNQIAGPVISGAEENEEAYNALYAGIAVKNSAVGGEVGVAKEDTIGGAYLTGPQVSAIRDSQMSDYNYALENMPMLERYFSPRVKESLTGNFAMFMPTTVTGSTHKIVTFAKTPSNIFSYVSNSIFKRTSAQTFPESNPFHVLNMGFPADHEIFTANGGDGMDPDEIKTKYQCDKPVNERPQNQVFDDVNGELPFPVPRNVDPCLLEDSVLDAGTRYFTGTYDEGIDSGSSTGNTSTSVGQAVIGDTFSTPCAPGSTDLGPEDGYSDGQLYKIRLCEIPGFPSGSTEDSNGLIRVNSTVSGQWLQLSQKAASNSITLRANSSFRTMVKQEYLYGCYKSGSCNGGNEAARPGFSNHQIGFAVDIDITTGKDPSLISCKANPGLYPIYQWLSSNAPPLGIEAKVQSECWHWSVGGN